MADEDPKDYVIPFGKHVDKTLDKTPLLYQDWLIGQDWLNEDTKEAITAYLEEPVIAKELDRQIKKKNEERI